MNFMAEFKLFGQRNFQHVHFAVWVEFTRSRHRWQEPHLALVDTISGAVAFEPPRAFNANQHARYSRDTDGKWQLSSQPPQQEVATINEPLAYHWSSGHRKGRHQATGVL